jgi:hypothetical protein
MTEQSGIYNFQLLKAETVNYTKISDSEITNVTGESIDVSQCERPNLQNIIKKIDKKIYTDFSLSFTFFGLDQGNFSQFCHVHGFMPIVNFQDGSSFLIDTPMFPQQSNFSTNETNKYLITLKPNRPSNSSLFEIT